MHVTKQKLYEITKLGLKDNDENPRNDAPKNVQLFTGAYSMGSIFLLACSDGVIPGGVTHFFPSDFEKVSGHL